MSMNPLEMMMRTASAVQSLRHPAAPITAVQVEAPRVFPAPSPFDTMMSIANSDGGEYAQYIEIHRICSLPIVPSLSAQQIEEFNHTHVLAEAYARGFRLHDIQCNAVNAYEKYGGGFYPIGVGWGKTLIALMIANAAWVKGIRRIIYCCPSNVYSQLVETDIKWARSKVSITYPIIEMGGGKGQKIRKAHADSGKNGCYIIPYSLASTADAEEVFYKVQPGLVILDECHEVRNLTAARTKRVMRVLRDLKPESVDLSGTITSKSIKDYHHLITHSLRNQSPLPLPTTLLNEWSVVLDADAQEESSATGPLLPLISWARQHFTSLEFPENVAGFRKAFRIRLETCPGVVASGDADIGISLAMHNRPVEKHTWYPNWAVLEGLIKQVTDMWLTPNLDEIEHAIHTWKWLYELVCGFYNQLTWPVPEAFADRRRISLGEAQDVLGRAMWHHAAGQEYAKLLRDWLQNYHVKGMDTPLLVGQEMARNGAKTVGSELYEAWITMKNLDFEGRPDRDKTAIRVCDFKINEAIRWAYELKGKGGIIWFYHNEVGRWIYDYLCHYGILSLYCPSGDVHNDTIRDPANKDKVVVASISAHGQGKNLQHFQEQYIVQWPRRASRAEQLLGRLHRHGQTADGLIVHTNNTLEWDHMNFAACLNDALYIHQTTGNRQKLIYAGYNPMPPIFPPAVLNERGLQLEHTLTREQQELLVQKFQV